MWRSIGGVLCWPWTCELHSLIPVLEEHKARVGSLGLRFNPVSVPGWFWPIGFVAWDVFSCRKVELYLPNPFPVTINPMNTFWTPAHTEVGLRLGWGGARIIFKNLKCPVYKVNTFFVTNLFCYSSLFWKVVSTKKTFTFLWRETPLSCLLAIKRFPKFYSLKVVQGKQTHGPCIYSVKNMHTPCQLQLNASKFQQ